MRSYVAMFGGPRLGLAGPDPLRCPARRHRGAVVVFARLMLPVLGGIVAMLGGPSLIAGIAQGFAGGRNEGGKFLTRSVFHKSP